MRIAGPLCGWRARPSNSRKASSRRSEAPMQVGELRVGREGEEAHRRVRLEQHDFACLCQAEIHAEEVERHTVVDRLKHSFDKGQEGPSLSINACSSTTSSG